MDLYNKINQIRQENSELYKKVADELNKNITEEPPNHMYNMISVVLRSIRPKDQVKLIRNHRLHTTLQ